MQSILHKSGEMRAASTLASSQAPGLLRIPSAGQERMTPSYPIKGVNFRENNANNSQNFLPQKMAKLLDQNTSSTLEQILQKNDTVPVMQLSPAFQTHNSIEQPKFSQMFEAVTKTTDMDKEDLAEMIASRVHLYKSRV